MRSRLTAAILLLCGAIVFAKSATAEADAPRLTVLPGDALLDEPVAIVLEGFRPDATVTVTASCDSADGSGRWQSTANFRAGSSGRIDLRHDSPSGGTYGTDADGMGLLWSMQPPAGVKTAFALPKNLDPLKVSLAAETVGKRVAETTIVRRQIAARGVRREPIHDGALVGELFSPDDMKDHPAVLVLGGSEGGVEEDIPALLASHGFTVFSVAYFGVEPLPKNLVEVPIETVGHALEFLLKQPCAAKGGAALLGTSRGAELALLAGTLFPKQVKAVAALVPTTVVFAGLEFGRGPVDKSPWTFENKPLPYITFATWEKYLASKDDALIEAATVPVERLAGPVLLLAGADDKLGLSGPMSDLAWQRLQHAKRPYGDEKLSYPAAGHLIGIPYLPTVNTSQMETPYGVLDFGGTWEANARAAADSWTKLLEFLKRPAQS